MVIAVAIVGVTPGCERSIYCRLKGEEGVLDIYHIFGDYDFFMILHADDLNRLNQLINTVLGMHGITAVRTILIGWDIGMQGARPITASA
jgi:DNA-binding Lrp family transcriptional regulator